MIYKATAVILVFVLLHGSLAAQDQPPPSTQTVTEMQSVLRKSQQEDKGVRVTLNKKMDQRRKVTGKVSEVSDADFTLIDQKTGNAMKLEYANVRHIGQKGMPKALTITLIVITGLVVAIVVATKPWQSE